MFDCQCGNAFHTTVSFSGATTASKLLETNTTLKTFITDFLFYSNTNGTFTLLENTTTTIFPFYYSNSTSSHPLNLNTPIVIEKNNGVHVTTTGTITSLFVSGFRR